MWNSDCLFLKAVSVIYSYTLYPLGIVSFVLRPWLIAYYLVV